MGISLKTEHVYGVRFKVQVEIFFGQQRQQLMMSHTYNMSTLGVFIETPHILPVDTPLVLEFRLPSFNERITCDARVAWINEPGALKKPSFPQGMGVQFKGLLPAEIRAIQDFLKVCEIDSPW